MAKNSEYSVQEAAELCGMPESEFLKRATSLKLPGLKSGTIKHSSLEKYFPIPDQIEYESKIIAISNQKGGEGKTTVSICLGEALSEHGKTLLVDWDPQANATNLFHKNPDKTIMDCLGYRGRKKIDLERIILPLTPNFHLVPSALDLANLTTPYERDDFELLKESILPVCSSYKYIVIDCPPSLGLILENALIAADYVLVPIQTRAFSVQGLKDLHGTIEKIRSKANPRLKLLGAVLNQFEGQKALAGLAGSIKRYFPVFQTVLFRRESIPQSQAKMSLLSNYDKETMKYFQELASEVIEKMYVQEK
jgi:chromosome partitioning protein